MCLRQCRQELCRHRRHRLQRRCLHRRKYGHRQRRQTTRRCRSCLQGYRSCAAKQSVVAILTAKRIVAVAAFDVVVAVTTKQ